MSPPLDCCRRWHRGRNVLAAGSILQVAERWWAWWPELPLWQALWLDVGPNPYLPEDRAEGIAAQLEKRRPRWTGR